MRMRWAGHVSGMRENRDAYKNLMGKADVKRPLGRFGRRWQKNW